MKNSRDWGISPENPAGAYRETMTPIKLHPFGNKSKYIVITLVTCPKKDSMNPNLDFALPYA